MRGGNTVRDKLSRTAIRPRRSSLRKRESRKQPIPLLETRGVPTKIRNYRPGTRLRGYDERRELPHVMPEPPQVSGGKRPYSRPVRSHFTPNIWKKRPLTRTLSIIGGWGEIRTHGGVTPTPVFKTGALNHSTTHP